MAALVASGVSCCTQCPISEISMTPRKSFTTRLMLPCNCYCEAPAMTTSLEPAINRVGIVIFTPSSWGVISQLR